MATDSINGQTPSAEQRALMRGLTLDQISKVKTPTLRFVATRCSLPNQSNGGYKAVMSRTIHYLRSDVTALQMLLANYFVPANGVDTGGGGDGSQFTASFENTAGVRFPAASWVGQGASPSATVTVANAGTCLTDPIPFVQKKDTKIAALWHGQYTTAQMLRPNYSSVASSPIGDTTIGNATSTPDLTTGSTVVGSNLPAYNTAPLGILGMSSEPAVLIIGDSIPAGQMDTSDVSGDLGYLARAVGEKYAYCTVAVAGEGAGSFVTSPTKRAALAAYATHAILQLGVNDISGTTAAILLTRRASIRAALKAVNPDILIYDTTIPPWVDSTDGYITTANQTARSTAATIASFNDSLRTVPQANMAGLIDMADFAQTYRNSNLLIPSPVANLFSDDGLHYKQPWHLMAKRYVLAPMGL